MPQLIELEARVHHLCGLQELVRALRGIAAVRMQESLQALQATRRYSAAIAEAIGLAMALLPRPPAELRPVAGQERLRLVIGTEHGFVGGLGERLVEALRCAPPGCGLAVAGRRTAALAIDQGLSLAWSEAAAAHVGGIAAVARRLAHALGAAHSVELVYVRYLGSGRRELVVQAVVPIEAARFDLARQGMPPLHHVAPEALLAELAGEFLLAELAQGLTEALTSENEARMRVMDAADRNITEKSAHLGEELRRLRQEAITTELLDVITGAEAVARPGRPP